MSSLLVLWVGGLAVGVGGVLALRLLLPRTPVAGGDSPRGTSGTSGWRQTAWSLGLIWGGLLTVLAAWVYA